MKPFPDLLATDRLILRPPTVADSEDVLAAVTASYPELHRWMAWARDPYGIEQARQFCADARGAFDAGRDFSALLTLAKDGTVVGSAAVLMCDEAVPSFEIGYWVHTGYTCRGYAIEAAEALTRLAFEDGGAKRIEARIDGRNRRSRAVVEHLGFKLEAKLKSHRRDNKGRLSDTLIYAMTDLQAMRNR